ncbi:MAG TPA: sugar kinase [Jatrophihabitans sp.]|uniref:carbohydrate kinase family protein n=1 Tax=Jatrophihabitans sp. TaxID=1932789 RepID=UPI002F1F2746
MIPGGGRVVCLGDVMLDIAAVLPAPLALASDTPAPIRFSHGGSAANTAAWLAVLGVPCVFAGRVGDDPFGRDAVATLSSHGVIPRVSIDPVTATGVCLVLIGPDGERTMVPSAGANATLADADLGADLLGAADHLHLSGYALLTEGSRAAGLFALRQAGAVGASVSVDAASAGPIRTVGPERFLGWIPAGALLLANADELAALTGTDDLAAGVAALVARGLDVVVKRGGQGSLLATAAGTWHCPAEPAEVLDSTGAGDAFAAGLLAARWGGAELVEALSQANRLGAMAVGKLGARPIM